MGVLRSDSLFQAICYHPDQHQVVTVGTDRKVSFWELFDASLIREIEGSPKGSVSAVDISANGRYFVTGGEDRLVKVRSGNVKVGSGNVKVGCHNVIVRFSSVKVRRSKVCQV